jgi:hypothetical protein
VQSGKTASGGCSAGQGSSEPVAPRIIIIIIIIIIEITNLPTLHSVLRFVAFHHYQLLLK